MPYAILGDLQTLTLEATATMQNACVILTLNNDVILMDNVTLDGYVSGSTFATLPESMRPMSEVRVPVFLDDAPTALTVKTDGTMSIPTDATGTLYLNGVTFNVCGTYYNSAIGNNFSQGTSPLS